MRILVASRAWWPAVKGGAEKFIARLAEWLAKLGHEVHVASRVRVEAPYAESTTWIRGGRLRWALGVARLVEGIKPDVVLFNVYWGDPAPWITRLKVGSRARIAGVLHDAWVVELHGLKAAAQKLNLRLTLRSLDLIIVPVETVKAHLARLGAPMSKVRVIGFEGVDEPTPPLHLEDEWFDLLQVARFDWYKGQLVVVEATRLLVEKGRRVKLWLVGGVTDWDYYRRVLEAARRVNVLAGWEAVRVVADAPSVEEYYRRADACIAASIRGEGYGLPVHECMAWGKPVVATEVFKRTGVAGEDRAIIVPPGDAEAIANAVEELISNAELRGRLAARGREWALARTWRAVAEAVQGFLLESAR